MHSQTNGYRETFAWGGNEVIEFQAAVRSPSNAGCTLFIEFYDAEDRLLKTTPAQTIPPGEPGKAEIYTLSPALTRYAVAIMACSGDGRESVTIESVSVINPHPSAAKEPEIDLDSYQMPLWKGDTVFDETVLFYAEGDAAPSGRLLYPPTRILSVRNHPLETTYLEGTDYTVHGNTITLMPDSRIPYKRDIDFPDTPLHYYEMVDSHIAVTYRHNESWSGPAMEYRGDRMPRTVKKLHNREPLRIVVYGDSITRGMSVSSFDQKPPYMPTWADIFTNVLRQRYGHPDIRLYNAALPGAVSAWGASEAELHITPLDPDLVIIAFGMNDFWSVDDAKFLENVRTIVSKVKHGSPQAEFILVSPMMFDPAYTNDGKLEYYRTNMLSYRSALLSLQDTGMQVYDMTTVSEYLYNRKKPKDFIPNPLHPGDYLARWYALGLAQMMVEV